MAVIRPAVTVGEFEIATIATGTFKENCYVVTHPGSGDCLVVDPGAEEAFLDAYLASRNVTPQKIVLTHGHFDHLGAADALMQRYGIPCEAHANEERLVRQAATYAFRFERGAALRVPRGLTYFTGESSLSWNGRPVDVLPTPGHTAGSVALVLGGAFVFTGDTLFHEYVGPTTYPESDPAAIVASVALLLDTLADACVIFPGHGKPWTIGAARAWWADVHESAPALTIHVPQAAGVMQTKQPRSRS
jgi:glyoxylase-like metal-dependent hydrolase (beta-lactamase superfamily II)